MSAAVIVPTSPWQKPDAERVEINGNCSLAKDLQYCWPMMRREANRDLVTGTVGTLAGSAVFAPVIGGYGLYVPNNGYFDTGTTGPTASAPGSIHCVALRLSHQTVDVAMSTALAGSSGISIQLGNDFGDANALYVAADANCAWVNGVNYASGNPAFSGVVNNKLYAVVGTKASIDTPTMNLRFGTHQPGAATFYLHGYVLTGASWLRQLTRSEAQWLTVEPYALFKPDIRRTYYLLAKAPSGGSSDGVGAADGHSTASGTGRSTHAAVGAADGHSTASGVGRAGLTGVGAADGHSTASAVGQALTSAVGSADGHSTASGTGRSTHAAVGAADGHSTASGVGRSTHAAVGSADGHATAAGTGRSTHSAAGAADGHATASAEGSGTTAGQGVGSATGTSTAIAVGRALAAAIGEATGFATAEAVGSDGSSPTDVAPPPWMAGFVTNNLNKGAR